MTAASSLALWMTLIGSSAAPPMGAAHAAEEESVRPALRPAGGTDGAFLRIEAAPRDALVEIDESGEWTPVPSGPLAAIPLSPGTHEVRLRLRGFMSRAETIRLGEGEGRTLFAPLTPKTRVGALLRAAVLPGLGSRYMDRSRRARILAVAGVGSAVAALAFDAEMSDRIDEYESKREAYLGAVTAAEIEAARRDSEAAFDRVEGARETRNAFLIALAGAYAVSLAEAVFFYPFDHSGAAAIERSDGGASGGGAAFRLVLARIPLARAAP